MLSLRQRHATAVATLALAVSVTGGTPAAAQELASHLAVYEVTTGRVPAGVTPPEVTGTYVFRLHSECGGALKFEQRFQFEAKGAGMATDVDQTSAGEESLDGKRYRFTHRVAVDGKPLPEIRGEVDLGAGDATARYSQPPGRTVKVPAGTLFPISIARRVVKAAQDGESGFEGRFFLGDKPEPPQAVSVLMGKPPRRVAELAPPQGDRKLIDGRDRFFFRASFYGDAKGTGEPHHEFSSVTLDNGIEIWGAHEQGELRLEYRLVRIESLPKPDC